MAGLLWYRSYMNSLANTNGYYPDIHAGHADRVAELTLEAPYLVRETPAGYNQLELAQIIGGTMVVEGSLQSVEATAHVTVGFNQWDEEYIGGYYTNTGSLVTKTDQLCTKNKIRVIPNTAYYFKLASLSGNQGHAVVFYDANDNFISRQLNVYNFTTPPNCEYINANFGTNYGDTYHNDICINISNPSLNGTYKPYTKTTTPLANITLRGIPMKDADGNLYYNGDTYEWDGTVTRKFGERAYQAGDESLTDAITDGTNTVYKLTTPTTESADPFTAVQTVEEGGTEEFVTSNNVPVGNVSVYRRA